ncbi:MAG TPA: hypothetical protein VJ689_00965 [Gaiellaceae bacterium]|nr:hypothetical protein [Gaiellaceae bacterium]
MLYYAGAVVLVSVGLFLFMWLMARLHRKGRLKAPGKGGINRQSRRRERAMNKAGRRK